MKTKLKIEHIPIDRIKPNDYNPNRCSEFTLRAIEEDIRENGFIDPIVLRPLRGDRYEIIDGEHRFKAAKALNLENLPAVIIRCDKRKAKKLTIAWNAKRGEFQEDILAGLIEELSIEVPLEELGNELGIEVTDLQELLEGEGEPDEEDPEEDVPAKPKKPKAKPGDRWILGEHWLICGDMRDPEIIKWLLEGNKAGMTFTDPPWNVDYGKLKGKWWRSRSIENDCLPREEWEEFVEAFCRIILEHTQGAIYICMGCTELPLVQQAFIELGGHWSTNIIWSKDRFTLGRSDYQRQYEPILYGWPAKTKRKWRGGRKQGDIWECKRPAISELHPTMKPIALVSRAIRNSSRVGDTVADFFGGSGSTLIACEKLKRRCRMVELDPGYCEVIVKRWERFTGEKAIRGDMS